MTVHSEFCRARALDARTDAASATLDNVRERCLRAAQAWEVMADRAERTARMRERHEAEKAARLAAEASA